MQIENPKLASVRAGAMGTSMSGGPTRNTESTLARRFCDGPGPHPGHPTVAEGCRTASRAVPAVAHDLDDKLPAVDNPVNRFPMRTSSTPERTCRNLSSIRSNVHAIM